MVSLQNLKLWSKANKKFKKFVKNNLCIKIFLFLQKQKQLKNIKEIFSFFFMILIFFINIYL